MSAKPASSKAAPVVEYLGFLENGLQTQDSFGLTQKALADRLVRAAIEQADLNTAIPTPSGMSLEMIDDRLALRMVDD